MTIRADYAEPCWEIVRVDTKQPPEADCGDGWAHYETEAAALAELAARQDAWGDAALTVQRSFPRPCLGLYCDGHECPDGTDPYDFNDEGWTHLDPSDPLPFGLPDFWEEIGGKHYCDSCLPSWCEDCDARHPEDGCPEPPRYRPRPVKVTDGQLALDGAL